MYHLRFIVDSLFQLPLCGSRVEVAVVTHNAFLEISPDGFATNDLSSTGKSMESLFTQYAATPFHQAYKC